MKSDATPLGELRSLVVNRFKSLEHSLRAKERFEEFADTLKEYINVDRAEPVRVEELSKPSNKIYYFLMHVVRKESSTTS